MVSDNVESTKVESKYFTLKIVLPAQVVYNDKVEYVKLASPEGELMIYPMHESYICAIAPSTLEYKTEKGIKTLKIERGFCKFQNQLCEIAVSQGI